MASAARIGGGRGRKGGPGQGRPGHAFSSPFGKGWVKATRAAYVRTCTAAAARGWEGFAGPGAPIGEEWAASFPKATPPQAFPRLLSAIPPREFDYTLLSNPGGPKKGET